ncbi:hypothetical protein Ciccas_007564 [Cichlidogyrus casuarinus]|uniref:E3 ubiquitin-protein ligase SHPRH n=1 Tax=Cichlidogyrus casuarinus TaxID=1844966 RepID=A0ABD2Q2U6_9PLAT
MVKKRQATNESVLMGDQWLELFHEMLDSCERGDYLNYICSQIKNKHSFSRIKDLKTLLLNCSNELFRGAILEEFEHLLKCHDNLTKAMAPLLSMWQDFKAGRPLDQRVLQTYYHCCSKLDLAVEKKKPEPKARNNELNKLKTVYVKAKKAGKCAYCKAAEAWFALRSAINYCREPSEARKELEALKSEDFLVDSDDDDLVTDGRESDGIFLNNPFVTAINLISSSYARTSFHSYSDRQLTKNLDRFILLLAKELAVCSKLQALTKEWWNLCEETDQFVTRLQSNSPADLAYIPTYQIDMQLQEQTAQAGVCYATLDNRLGHLRFLKNNLKDRCASTLANLECPACLSKHSEENPTFVMLPGCWHTLCEVCYKKLDSSHSHNRRKCPICRYPFPSASLVVTAAQEKARRRCPLTYVHFDKHKPTTNQESFQQMEEEEEFPVNGDYSRKIVTVIRELHKLHRDDPDVKVLIFCSWACHLGSLKEALARNGYTCATMFHNSDARRPSEDLESFKDPTSSCSILLMSLEIGCNGLNITEANHVFLLDPILNSGQEAQAIARIHRIGQTRECFVHRFLVQDSIEAGLHAIYHAEMPLVKNYTHSATKLHFEDQQLLAQLTVGKLLHLLSRSELDSVSG